MGDRHTIGILHPGEMGARVAGLLGARGHRVLCAAGARGPETRRRARLAGVEEAGSLGALAAHCEVVISLVTPDAAEATARGFAEALPAGRHPLYVDMNSVAPDVVRRLALPLLERGVRFVDGSIHGRARDLGDRAVILLAGPDAPCLAPLLAEFASLRVLGGEIGGASLMKMLLGALAKSLVALGVELAAAARAAEAWLPFAELVDRFYPGLLSAVEHMAPSYPRHAARRVVELRDAERTLCALAGGAAMTGAAGEVIRELAAAAAAGLAPGAASLAELADSLGTLRRERSVATAIPRTTAEERS